MPLEKRLTDRVFPLQDATAAIVLPIAFVAHFRTKLELIGYGFLVRSSSSRAGSVSPSPVWSVTGRRCCCRASPRRRWWPPESCPPFRAADQVAQRRRRSHP